MSGLFIEILNLSLSGGCVALIVMLLRLIIRRASKKYSYALWAVVFFRLICPFTIQLPVSAVPVQPQTIPQNIVYSESPAIQSGVSIVDNTVNHAIERALPPFTPANSINPVQIVLEIGAYLWIAGILVLLLYGIISYLRLKKRVSTAIRVHDNIYETDFIKTPFVLGFIRPKIFIPTGLGDKELEYVITHERTHIKRLDYLIKPFAFLVTSAHWFNPIAWVSYALMARDMELSADESVMKHSALDIRGDYSNSLLALSVKKSGLLNPLAFGETSVKERVKNVLNYKKPAFWISVVTVLVVILASLLLVSSKTAAITKGSIYYIQKPYIGIYRSNKSANEEMQSIDITGIPNSLTANDEDGDTNHPSLSTYDRVKITFLSDMTGFKSVNEFETTAAQIVAFIENALVNDITSTDKSVELEGNNINRYQIELRNDIGGYSAMLYYDTLYDQAYVGKDSGIHEINTDFARYIDSLLENSNINTNIAADAAKLFQAHGWTLVYRINAMESKLNDIRSLSGFNPNAYYFAYNNELSKDIGLDMSGYSNSAKIDVEVYRIHESMPQEFYPIQNCRGIVVRIDDKIIGAFISAGRHSTFNACSLKGSRFENVTSQTLNDWLAGMVKTDNTEERLSKLDSEQIIEEYFTALGNKDAKTAEYCISKRALLGNLTANMLNEDLFNEGIGLPLTDADFEAKSNFDNMKSAKLLKVELLDESEQNVKTFRVTVSLQYNQERSIGSGEQFWDCTMIYESPQTGWKIEGFGH